MTGKKIEELLIQLQFLSKYLFFNLKDLFFSSFQRNQQFQGRGESFDRPEVVRQRDPGPQMASKSSDMLSIVQDFDFEAAERLSSRIQSSNRQKDGKRRRSRSRSRSPDPHSSRSNRDGKHETSWFFLIGGRPFMTSLLGVTLIIRSSLKKWFLN